MAPVERDLRMMANMTQFRRHLSWKEFPMGNMEHFIVNASL